MVAPLVLIGAAVAISTGLTILDELNQGTPLEQIPAEILDPQSHIDAIGNTVPLFRETAELFADVGDAVKSLVQMGIFFITPNPANIVNFDALKKSTKMMLSIPLVQIFIILVIIGGSIGTVITNETLMKKLLETTESWFFDKS